MTRAASDKRIAVLAYHKIGPPPPNSWDTWYYIPEHVFTAQMALLGRSTYSVIDLATFLAGLERPEVLPERSVLLTFDDGHLSMRTIALPILQRFEVPAVCFVPTDYIGGRSTFHGGREPEEAMCTWDDLRALECHGVAIQSHTASHPWLSLANPQSWALECAGSKRVLEDGLNRPVETFAFPFSDAGRHDEVMNAVLRGAGYRAAFLCGGGPPTSPMPPGNPYRMDRFAVYRDSDLSWLLESV